MKPQTVKSESKKPVMSLRESLSRGSLWKTTITALTPILVILIVSFAVYFNALFGNFVYDDHQQIVENRWIKDIRNIPVIFSKGVWDFQPGMTTSNYYRPLMHVVYMLNYHVFGLRPWGFHLVNVLFHCGVSVLVFLIVRKLFIQRRGVPSPVFLSPPFISAVLFAAHPIHTEAVAWISGLPDAAFAFFYLLSFYFYLLFRGGAKRAYLLSVLSFSVSTLFKEPALTLPLVLAAYDYLLHKRDKIIISEIKTYIPYIVVSAAYLLIRYYALRSFAPVEYYSGLSTYQSIINVFPLFRKYLTSLLWPLDLNLWHAFHPINSLVEAKGMISVVVTVIFFIAAGAAYRKNKAVLFGLILIVAPLLPAFYIKGIGGMPFAERYLYLPSVGFVFLPAIFLSWAGEKLPRTVRSISIIFMIVVGSYCIVTVDRNTIWKDNFSLWSDTVKKSPDIAMAHNNLGNAYASKGMPDMAITEYQTALRLAPDHADFYSNLGNAYASKGMPDTAITEYQTALRLNPDYADAHYNLGNAYASKGLQDMAITEYQTALRLKPGYDEAHYNLGNAYASKGLSDMAITEYQAALRLNPDYADAHYNLGNAYASKGLSDMAIREYQTALRLKPDYAMAHNNLGDAYASTGLSDMAIREYQTALRLNPDYAMAHNNLGVQYASKGLLDMAMTEFQTALRLNPGFVDAHYNLAIFYLRQGNADSARKELEVVLRIRPDLNSARKLLHDINSRRP